MKASALRPIARDPLSSFAVPFRAHDHVALPCVVFNGVLNGTNQAVKDPGWNCFLP